MSEAVGDPRQHEGHKDQLQQVGAFVVGHRWTMARGMGESGSGDAVTSGVGGHRDRVLAASRIDPPQAARGRRPAGRSPGAGPVRC